jgi:Domain of unknown function (DUF4384)
MRLAATFFAVLGLAGCASVSMQTPVPEFSAPKPIARTTAFTKPLACLGDLYSTYSSNNAPLLISVMPAGDSTGASQSTSAEVPREFTLMVESAVNSVSPRIRLINVDHEFQVRENAVGGKFTRVAPRLLLKPSISEFDRGLSIAQSKQDLSGFFGKGKGATDFSIDKGKEDVTSRLAIDMMAYEYGTMSSIPNVHASVGAEVGRKSANQGWSLSIYGWGIGNTASNKAIQGRHEALRVITEYAVLQTLGRYLKLPYWRCVEGMEEDLMVKQSLSQFHQKLPSKEKLSSVQELLQYHGFEQVQKSGVVDITTQTALSQLAQANPDIQASADSLDLYYKLYVSIPVSNVPNINGWRLIKELNAAKHPEPSVSMVPMNLRAAGQEALPTKQSNAVIASAQKSANNIPVQTQAIAVSLAAAETAKVSNSLTNAKPVESLALQQNSSAPSLRFEGPPLTRGAKVSLRLTAPVNAYAYCFLQEASGDIKLIYPNRFAPGTRLTAGTLALPGHMRFNLTTHEQGKAETVACMTTQQDVKAQLPMNAKDFVALPLRTLDEAAQLLSKLDDAATTVTQIRIQAP